ncbi:MAG: ABC transporter ATP-binding protein [Planctomycetes bacterium]|nr:ABC transporter ATP-binding protein [Planctomycetota bacterium]
MDAADRPKRLSATGTVFKVIWPIMRPYRCWLALSLILGGIHGAAISFQIVFPKYLVDDILRPHDLPDAQRWKRLVVLAAVYLVTSVVLRMLVWHLGYRVFTWVRERVVLALRAQFFRHVNHLCLRFHGQHPSGELFSYLFGSPLNQIMQFYQHTSMHGPGAVVTLVATVLVCAKWDSTLTLILALSVMTSTLMMRRSSLRVKAITKDFQETEGDVSGRISDILRGNRAVKLYAMENQVATTFDEAAQVLSRKSYERDIRQHMEWMKQEGFFYLANATLMAACTWRYLGGHVQEGEVVGFLLAFQQLQQPTQFLFTSLTLWGGAQASIERIGTVLTQASTTPDPVGPELPVPPGGEIELRDVTFAYEDAPVISQMSLKIPYGQRVAFVGPSGAGKSTVSQLLLRLYDPQQGSLLLAGVDLRRLPGIDLRKRFGVVPQDPFIFRTTIRDNVRVARPDADDDAIRRACELANAWEFIDELPDKLLTRVGEGGSSLSGGQRQRLAIARVLLADPPFFIFDEATSALDTLSEELIQKALERNLRGRTAIFIAHRLATVKNVDRIIVMRGGRVEQDGTYDDLVAQPGLFRQLVEGQQLRG